MPETRAMMLPGREVRIEEHWDVLGLRGTGSIDYTMDSVFVPDGWSHFQPTTVPERGGNLYGMGIIGFAVTCHSGWAMGVGRRMLDELAALVKSKAGRPGAQADNAAFQQGYAEAEAAFRAASEQGTNSGGAYSRPVAARLANLHAELGEAYAEAGALNEAIAELRRAVNLGPAFHDLRYRLARLLLEASRPLEAREELEKILAEHADFVDAQASLGLAHYLAGDASAAAEIWGRCRTRRPNNARVEAYLAMARRLPTCDSPACCCSSPAAPPRRPTTNGWGIRPIGKVAIPTPWRSIAPRRRAVARPGSGPSSARPRCTSGHSASRSRPSPSWKRRITPGPQKPRPGWSGPRTSPSAGARSG
jgi:hypothetical protein